MSHPTATWPVSGIVTIDPVGPDEPTVPATPLLTGRSMFGRGLIHPFGRDRKGDFANTDGPALIRSSVTQIIGTKASSEFAPGELAWRGGFGSLAHLLKHAQNNPALRDLANLYVIQALNRWEPRIRIKDVRVESISVAPGEENALRINALYDFLDINTGEVVFQDLETCIQI